ncbi:MAG: adenylate/guanylate cyclase domain-containing protein [Cyanobacteria bacterium P01_C01_bin.89]
MTAMDPLLLSFLMSQGMAYLRVNHDGQIYEASPEVRQFSEAPEDFDTTSTLDNHFPELIGLEAIFEDLICGELSHFQLQGIARPAFEPDPSLYFDLTILVDHSRDRAPFILFLNDVTEDMKMKQRLTQNANEVALLYDQLSASQTYINRVIVSMADGLLVTDKDGIIETCNPAVKTLLGYHPQELLHRSLTVLLEGDSFAIDSLHPKIDQGEELVSDLEVIGQTKLGQRRTLSFSCGVLQGKRVDEPRFIHVFRDVTERQRSQTRMQVQYSAVRTFTTESDMSQAISKILQIVCSALDWHLGQLWLASDNEKHILRCTHTWKRSQRLKTFANFLSNTRPGWGSDSGDNVDPFHLRKKPVWIENLPRWLKEHKADGVSISVDNQSFNSTYALLSQAATAGAKSVFGFPLYNSLDHMGMALFFDTVERPSEPDYWPLAAMLGSHLGQFIQRKRAEAALRISQAETERLLLNILPESVADQLRNVDQTKGSDMETVFGSRRATIAEDFPEVTVMFADIVGFTALADKLPPLELVQSLNQIFSRFDRLTEAYNLEKIKTIGDSYMVVGGLPELRTDHAQAIASMALDMQETLGQLNQEQGKSFQIRIGIHTGPVVAGVIGLKKFAYDLWGDTVNVASRMESHGEPGRIQVSEVTYNRLKGDYIFKPRGEIKVKGKGGMTTYFLQSKCLSET